MVLAETLTLTNGCGSVLWSRQLRTWRQACSSTKAVSGTISPLFSARSMNRPGSSVPNVGCSQRSRASAPMMRLSASRMIGW
ncbi:Uncharacterised protein [Mycobacterium tuberculosis]|nr:Uncharacterised protein [Mycobacterium tuberculosis]